MADPAGEAFARTVTPPQIDIPSVRPDENLSPRELLERAVFESLGRASVCWEDFPSGVFLAEQAKAVGENLLECIDAFVQHKLQGSG
jgi:hypothetical protein